MKIIKNIFEDFKNITSKSNLKLTKLVILEETIKLVDTLSPSLFIFFLPK